MTWVAMASRSSREAWAAIRDSASSRVQPRSRIIRSIWSSAGTSTTMTASKVSARPDSASSGMSWTTSAPAGAAASSSAYRSKISGWVIASRRRRADSSEKTIRPSAARSRSPSGGQQVLAELLDHLRQPRRTARHDLAGQGISVDEHGAELDEELRHGALARGDTSCQTDPHRPSVPHRRSLPAWRVQSVCSARRRSETRLGVLRATATPRCACSGRAKRARTSGAGH